MSQKKLLDRFTVQTQIPAMRQIKAHDSTGVIALRRDKSRFYLHKADWIEWHKDKWSNLNLIAILRARIYALHEIRCESGSLLVFANGAIQSIKEIPNASHPSTELSTSLSTHDEHNFWLRIPRGNRRRKCVLHKLHFWHTHPLNLSWQLIHHWKSLECQRKLLKILRHPPEIPENHHYEINGQKSC